MPKKRRTAALSNVVQLHVQQFIIGPVQPYQLTNKHLLTQPFTPINSALPYHLPGSFSADDRRGGLANNALKTW